MNRFYIDNPSAVNGLIPNVAQARQAHAIDVPSDVDILHELEVPWDAATQPPVTNWSTYKDYLKSEALKIDFLRHQDCIFHWWIEAERRKIDIDKLFIKSQGNKGSCAGVSMFERCYLISIIKQIARYSEQEIEPINPMVSYALSHNCEINNQRIPNGQTIAAVLEVGAKIGTFPASITGSYDDSARFNAEWLNHTEDAERRQMGVCPLTYDNGDSLWGEDMADAIRLAVKANKVVEIGNSIAISDDTIQDENGVYIGQLSGRWMHATCISDYMKKGDKEYVWWGNSHGEIYHNSDGSPRWGTWLQYSQLIQFCGGNYCDAGVITYAEAPLGDQEKDLSV